MLTLKILNARVKTGDTKVILIIALFASGVDIFPCHCCTTILLRQKCSWWMAYTCLHSYIYHDSSKACLTINVKTTPSAVQEFFKPSPMPCEKLFAWPQVITSPKMKPLGEWGGACLHLSRDLGLQLFKTAIISDLAACQMSVFWVSQRSGFVLGTKFEEKASPRNDFCIWQGTQLKLPQTSTSSPLHDPTCPCVYSFLKKKVEARRLFFDIFWIVFPWRLWF